MKQWNGVAALSQCLSQMEQYPYAWTPHDSTSIHKANVQRANNQWHTTQTKNAYCMTLT